MYEQFCTYYIANLYVQHYIVCIYLLKCLGKRLSGVVKIARTHICTAAHSNLNFDTYTNLAEFPSCSHFTLSVPVYISKILFFASHWNKFQVCAYALWIGSIGNINIRAQWTGYNALQNKWIFYTANNRFWSFELSTKESKIVNWNQT